MNPLRRFWDWLRQWPTRYDIGRLGDVYLTRWTVLGKRYSGQYRAFLHLFHRSDADALHDHPWSFITLILWGGYFEQTPKGTRWRPPGSLLFRPALWKHRVVIPPGKKALTLVITGPKKRSWGFYCEQSWRPWREHAKAEERTGNGCAETS